MPLAKKNQNIFKISILMTAAGFLLLPAVFVSAQRTSLNLDNVCNNDSLLETECDILGKEECQKLLEDCQDYFEGKKAQVEKEVAQTAQEKKTLTNQVYSLDKKIKDLSYQISQSSLAIKNLNFQIDDTNDSIGKTSNDIEDQKRKIALVLQAAYEEDQKSDLEIILANDTLSDFYDNLVYLENLSTKNHDLLTQIREMKDYLQSQKSSLEEQTEELKNTVAVREMQKDQNTQTKQNKQYYLTLTEAQYKEQLKEQQDLEKKAAAIRARIFELAGVSDAPTFGEAYQIAKYVEGVTGVRAAFLLGILNQESSIGKNVGQCYVTNFNNGAGVRTSGQKLNKVMHPTRDIPPFLQICKEVGRDSSKTLVSCPIASVGGYGGAMGPAQFIPSTWAYIKPKVVAVTGKAADPWNIRDAFLASGLYLKSLGAANNEFTAAMKYFSGATWTKNEEFYGRSVLNMAAGFQDDIDALERAGQ
ncbi:MAG: lytic murein transglycosylase [Candidatus Paceibacterota bacterium]|jgi:membrane-bound lytic murein transglycosylase B